MLWGYGLFQLLLGIRLGAWLGEQPFSPLLLGLYLRDSGAICGLKLALAGVASAQVLALPVFMGANGFIGYLTLHALRTCFSPASYCQSQRHGCCPSLQLKRDWRPALTSQSRSASPSRMQSAWLFAPARCGLAETLSNMNKVQAGFHHCFPQMEAIV